MSRTIEDVRSVFEGDAVSLEVLRCLLRVPFEEHLTIYSAYIHTATGRYALATRSASLILTLKASSKVTSSRVRRAEQTSANRWHLEIPLATPADVDAELLAWLRQAYELA